MKTWIVVLAVVLAVTPCQGQDKDAAKRAKVEELMTTMHIDTMTEQTITQPRMAARPNATRPLISPDPSSDTELTPPSA